MSKQIANAKNKKKWFLPILWSYLDWFNGFIL
jgi:hypothetical protein